MHELSFRWVFVLALVLVFGYIMWRVRTERSRLRLQLPLWFVGTGVVLTWVGVAISLLFGFSLQDALLLKGPPGSYGVVSGYALTVAGTLGCVVSLVDRLRQNNLTRDAH
jgi:hypothetical protein